MPSRLLFRAVPLAALLTLACNAEDELPPLEQPPVLDPCEGLSPLSLTVSSTQVRVLEPVALTAKGGSGAYRFRAEAGGSSGQLIGSSFIAGRTPGTDTLVVEDARCSGNAQGVQVADARATVQVVAAFDVAPGRAMVRPGTTFQVATQGLIGGAEFTLLRTQAGSTLSAEGVYKAGTGQGLDQLRVRDTRTGDEALLEFEVSKDAKLRANPQVLALPPGSSAQLDTTGGSDRVVWTKVSGPGVVSGNRIVTEPGAREPVLLEAVDPFTGDKVQATVRVMEELTRPSQPHGRLTDVAALVSADFDGDGFEDVAVGRRESDLGRPSGGAVFIYRGSADGLPREPTWVLAGVTDTASFGETLAAGDLDGDRRAELAVGSPGADITGADSGAVYLYRWGGSGPELMRSPLTSVTRGGVFSAGLALADADGDGDLDIIASAPAGDLAPSSSVSRRGTVDIFTLTPGQPVPDLPSIRLGGNDLAKEGGTMSRSNTDFGRTLVVADLNGDGRADIAGQSKVSRYNSDGSVSATVLTAVSVHFGRADGQRFRANPDVYLLPSNTADSNEGTWRLGSVPGEGGRPPLLMVLSDRANSPDLSSSGGVRSGADSGGVLLFNLSAFQPTGEPPEKPVQMLRTEAFAQIYGEAANINAGRSWAVVDVDRQPGPELVLGAPYASTPTTPSLGNAGRLLAYPLATLTQGSILNKPLSVLQGQNALDVLGAGLAPWSGPGGPGLVAFSGRSTSEAGAFVGRVESFARSGASLAEWTRKAHVVLARPAVERFGEVVAAAVGAGNRTMALVGMPGYAGMANSGNDFSSGRAYVYDVTRKTAATLVVEGATAPLTNGRNVGTDVTFTDFNGDGRQDLVVGSPALSVPNTSQTAELAVYATAPKTGCVQASNQAVGGLVVSLGQADGSFKDAYRLWAPVVIGTCTPETDGLCRRSQIGRGLVGGFDFNGDGKEDIGALRNNGFEVFLGRAPDDGSLAKLSMGCDPVYSTQPSTVRQTSATAVLGDLNADGCDEVGWRYTESGRAGVIILLGYDAGGTRCGGRKEASWVRVAADAEVGTNNLGLGVAMARAGNFLNDKKDRVAISASSVPFEGVTQPVVLLFETTELLENIPASGEKLMSALGGTTPPVTLVHRTRAVNFGRAMEGGKDWTGDGIPDLIISAPGASVASDGGGAVFLYAGGAQSKGALTPWMIAVGDVNERSNLGQDLSLSPGATGVPPTLVIGAPTSYRTGTQNGTAFALPLGP
ncbi:FG-GAP-like repeat-containing protein [Stigmatella sp. ncwal1]|uniref:FG-GAP-like repeat-containing protein n=1 Tax=Stigmatella ashevillensis TaxID=2995309 RepID=A0ABT5DB32_9BACT|nr:FG-GAP-like repeat-containing protein [Stigmatella ashevillena]MDC0710338.1 FG-GAP-like repeat-containing protein [Stigmatella ashevillena]